MRRKTPSSHPTAESNLSLLQTGMSTKTGDELILRHFYCSRENCRCMITATSITADMHLRHQHDLPNKDIGHLERALQLRDCRSFLHAEPRASVIVHNGACQRQCPASTSSKCGISTNFSRPAPEKLLNLQQRNLSGLLHWTKGNSLCAMRG